MQITQFTITEQDFAAFGQYDEWSEIISRLQDTFWEHPHYFEGSDMPVHPDSYHDIEAKEICYILENDQQINYLVVGKENKKVGERYVENKLIKSVMRSPEKFISLAQS